MDKNKIRELLVLVAALLEKDYETLGELLPIFRYEKLELIKKLEAAASEVNDELGK